MKFFVRYWKPHWRQLAVIGLLDLVSALCTLFLPYCMTDIVDRGIRMQDGACILRGAILMAILAVAALLSALVVVKLSSGIGAAVAAALQKDLFRKVNSLSFEEYFSIGTASFLTRETNDVDMLRDVGTMLAYYIVTIPVFLLGGCVLALCSDWVLSLLLFAAIPLILLLVRLLSRKVAPLWEISDRMIDKQNAIVRERLSGIRVIRAFDREPYEHGRIAQATKRMSDAIIRANIMDDCLNPAALFLVNAVTVGILALGGVRMQSSAALTAGKVIAAMQYAALMADGILSISWLLVWLPELKVSLRRIREVFALPSADDGGQKARTLRGEIRVRGLTFSYGGAPVLKQVDFEAGAGEIVGIIGGTGAGKTTLLKLLLGFYDGYTGEISLGGASYRDLSKAEIRQNLSVALQKSMIFEGTAAENIRIGCGDASDEAVREAARVAQIDAFFAEQADGYEHRLAQLGSNLSGGQKQRINIARTILKDASVYLFDDSFSALDFLTESRLRRALGERLRGKTQIIVTQRAATAMRCDRIYVLHEGEVVGVGTHAQLLAACPIYREICASQLGGER